MLTGESVKAFKMISKSLETVGFSAFRRLTSPGEKGKFTPTIRLSL
jgi:hypothetical protein